MGIRYAEKLQIAPVYAPASTTAAVETEFTKLENMQWISWLMIWGAMTSDSTDVMKIMVKSATGQSTNTNDTGQSFKYRLCEAVGGDTWGAITSSTGLEIGADQDNKALIIDIDPAVIARTDSDAEYAYLDIDASDLIDNYGFAIFMIGEPRYPQNANLAST